MTASLHDFEQLVLLALLRLGPRAYGIAIATELMDRTGRSATLGSVYKTLTRLEQKGYVRTTVGEPTPERGGRRKRYYRLSPSGRAALAESLAAIQSLTAGIEGLLPVKP
jgi:DNA-binding PadR family transcriptional regulator